MEGKRNSKAIHNLINCYKNHVININTKMTLFATAFIYTQTQLHVPQLVKKYPKFCGILMFMTLLTTVSCLFLSTATGMKDTF